MKPITIYGFFKAASSKAYKAFCEHVYQIELLHFNMIESYQLSLLIKELQGINAKNILDVGCGLGSISLYIAKKTLARLTGIDLSKQAITLAKNNTPKELTSQVDYLVEDMNNISMKNTFDYIIAIDSINFTNNFKKTIQDLKSRLKPKGRILILT